MANEENHIPDHIYISPYNGTWSRERLDETYVEYTLTSEVTSSEVFDNLERSVFG